jgi:RimJ/RimL family protein N-acetyltransferase
VDPDTAAALYRGEAVPGLPVAAGFPGLVRVGIFRPPRTLVVFVRKDDGTVVGDCTVEPDLSRGLDSVVIAFGIATSQQGQGIASEAIPALVGGLLADPDLVLHAVWAEMRHGDEVTARILGRAGLERVGETAFGPVYARARG